MKRRYCIGCDEYTNANPCRECGADTEHVPADPGRCAICRCRATSAVHGFRVCAYHLTHGEDDPTCPTCHHPKELTTC